LLLGRSAAHFVGASQLDIFRRPHWEADPVMITLKRSGEILATTVERMDSPAKRARGLMKYENAPKNFAAIFFLPLGGFFPLIHTFGMKFPIDIIFCDKNKKVISKFLNVNAGKIACPWKFFFGGCRYVVEFSEARISQLQIGDELLWDES
jgi:uncharacterized membrane protein (UPF0127 family)